MRILEAMVPCGEFRDSMINGSTVLALGKNRLQDLGVSGLALSVLRAPKVQNLESNDLCLIATCIIFL